MNIGDYLKMTDIPTEVVASKYCTEAGLYIGCVCEYVSNDGVGVVLQKMDTSIDSDPLIYVGIDFLKTHFKKDLRFKNLEKLGI